MERQQGYLDTNITHQSSCYVLMLYWWGTGKKKDKNIPSIYKNFMNACGGIIREEVCFSSNIK